MKLKYLFAIGLLIIVLTNLANAASTSNSFSATTTQFTNPSVSSPSFEYSSLISGVTGVNGESNSLYDMQLFIPPLGCKPYVVRSDLLEEQNVPVFCQVMALKINPGVDISRIDRVVARQQGSNPYISGIGFYPARAAIRASSGSNSIPADNTVGYVVVVLKKQNSEKDMPDFVNTTLSAFLQYSSSNSFGIGQTEYYLPVLTDSEFANSYNDYSFFNGIGYLKLDDVDVSSAMVSIYRIDGTSSNDLRKVWSQRIVKGATSNDFIISTFTGGQRLKLTVDDITVPQTKAKLMINGQTFEVYKGGRFYNNKCTLNDVVSTGGGSGNVKVSCSGSGKVFNLIKKFNQVSLIIRGSPEAHSVGDDLILYNLSAPDKKINFYVASIGTNPTTKINYMFLAKSSSNNLLDSTQAGEIGKSIDRALVGDYAKDPKKLTAQKVGGYDLVYIEEGSKNEDYDVELTTTINFNKPGNSSRENYYSEAVNSFEDVKTKFGTESNFITNQTYGADALWSQYNLAEKLGLFEDSSKVLSRILNEYPSSLNKVEEGNQLTASAILSQTKNQLLSSEGSSDYDQQTDTSIELVQIKEPASDEASVSVSYTSPRGSDGNRDSNNYDLREKQVVSSSDNSFKLTLDSFSADNAYFSYECNKSSVRTVVFKQGELKTFSDCDFKLQVNKINLKRVAKIELTPYTDGQSQESNFSFSIGIEKRLFAMNLTPEQANEKMNELNKKIADLKNLTQSLGDIIQAGKLACLATNAYLNIKVALSGSSASARTEVMTRSGGWNDICKSLAATEPSSYANMDDCIKKKSSIIENDIKVVAKIMEDYNTQVKGIEKTSIDSKSGKPSDNLALQNSVKQLSIPSSLTLIDADSHTQTLVNGKSPQQIISSLNSSLGDVGWTDSRDLWINLQIAQSSASEDFKKSAKIQVYNTLNAASKKMGDREEMTKQLTSTGLPVSFPENSKMLSVKYTAMRWNDAFRTQYGLTGYKNDKNLTITENDRIAIVPSIDKATNAYVEPYYLVGLTGNSNTLDINGGQVYVISGVTPVSNTPKTLTKYNFDSNNPGKTPALGVKFVVLDETAYNHKCTNCNYMEVFSLEPNKGQPALLPFDENGGWYVYTQSSVGGLGNKATFQDSGAVNSFYLCNVGSNGLMESMGNDDLCQMFNTYTGQSTSTYSGLSADKAKNLITNAQRAIQSAQTQLTQDPSRKTIVINGMTLQVRPVEGSSGGKCTDFMSSSDCALMFNVCDPFVCPSSRCDFGGQYKVDNVIQSGLVGSIALCLPNSVFAGGDVYVPVCITGISAGLEGITSILESYRDCINASVTTNQTIGICDQIYSVYACDFWWKNVGPFASTIAKNIFSLNYLFGKGNRGGGEYMFTNTAWSNAEKSWELFSKSYASESKLAFGGKSFTEIGSELCKSKLSATYPNFDSILAPDSPVQLYASFEEAPYSDATVPPTSQYSVYYHIYAGNDTGANYQIYLTDGVVYPGYISKDSSMVTTGYVNQGGYVSDKKDFLDVSGFKKLCVRVNAKDYCGFKQVSTDFGLNYLKDKAIKNQATTSGITSESECVSGSSSISSVALSGGNLQSAGQNALNPQIYNYGIVRICSTNNPGAPQSLERWTEVGTCGQSNIKCWIDGNSVKNALIYTGTENQTLAALKDITTDNLLKQGYLGKEAGDVNISALKMKYASITEGDNSNLLLTGNDLILLSTMDSEVQTLYDKLIVSSQKGQLLYIKAEIYYAAARRAAKSSGSSVVPSSNTPTTSAAVPVANTPQITYDSSSGELALTNTGSGAFSFTKLSNGILQYGLSNIGSVTSGGTITIQSNLLSAVETDANARKIIMDNLNGKNINSFEKAGSGSEGVNPCKTDDTCLRCMAYAEASGSTSQGTIPVTCTQVIMSTITNRLNNDNLAGSTTDICSIVSSANQYTAYNSPKYVQCCSDVNTLNTVPSAPINNLIEADSFANAGTTAPAGNFVKVDTPTSCNYNSDSAKPIFDFYKATG